MAHQKLNQCISSFCKKFSALRLHGVKPPCRSSSILVSDRSSKTHFSSAVNYSQTLPHHNKVISTNLKSTSSLIESTEYICPGLAESNKGVILEKPETLGIYDCPTILNRLQDIIAPEIHKSDIATPPSTQQDTPKHAAIILKIRRRKMNKHKLRKVRFRHMYKRRAIRKLKEKKKEMIFQEELASIAKWAADFNADKFIESELELARRGGFGVDVFKTQELRKKD